MHLRHSAIIACVVFLAASPLDAARIRNHAPNEPASNHAIRHQGSHADVISDAGTPSVGFRDGDEINSMAPPQHSLSKQHTWTGEQDEEIRDLHLIGYDAPSIAEMFNREHRMRLSSAEIQRRLSELQAIDEEPDSAEPEDAAAKVDPLTNVASRPDRQLHSPFLKPESDAAFKTFSPFPVPSLFDHNQEELIISLANRGIGFSDLAAELNRRFELNVEPAAIKRHYKMHLKPSQPEWSPEQDQELLSAVQHYRHSSSPILWPLIASRFPGCQYAGWAEHRYKELMKMHFSERDSKARQRLRIFQVRQSLLGVNQLQSRHDIPIIDSNDDIVVPNAPVGRSMIALRNIYQALQPAEQAQLLEMLQNRAQANF